MKYDIKHSMDFDAVKIEENKVDPYCIHLEDYESINDLIERSIITHSKPDFDHIDGAHYDSDDDIKALVEQDQYIDQSPKTEQAELPTEADAEQSEGKAESISKEAENV